MNHDDHPYTHLGFTLFLSLTATALVVFVLFHVQGIWSGVQTILSALSPLFVGYAISYILHPLAIGMEALFRKKKALEKYSRPLSVLCTMLLAVLSVTLFVVMVVPQLGSSISSLVDTLPTQIQNAIIKVETYLQRDEEWAARLIQVISGIEKFVTDWLEANLLNSIGTIASNIVTVGSFVVNLLMSIIVAVYLLLGWERYCAQCKKLFLAVSKNERANSLVFTAMEQTNRIFSGFINGKLMDSLIVAVICFISLSIMRMPYALLISVIVGVTNIIPVFGPFIGAVPSAFLVLLVSPPKCLAFLIFIVILQQIDGNIIGPRILGDSTGLSALYVMTAMLLFGKLMGFLGMVIGVPLFATLYYVVKQLAEYSLKKQHLPLETTDYAAKGQPKKKE